MKKASVILVALLLLVGMSLSAEGKWTNWGEGIMYPLYKVGDADATAGWGPVDWKAAGGESGNYQQWQFAFDGDNFGFYAVWGFDGKDNFSGLTRYAVYFQPFDMLKVIMGAPRVSDYRPASFIEGNHTGRLIDADHGAVVQLMPIEGLSAAAAVYIPNADPATVTMDWGQAFGFGASYALPNIATLYATARLDQEWFNASVNVTALEGIGLMASFKYDWTEGEEGMYVLASAKAAFGPVNVMLDAGLKNNLGTLFDTLGFGANLDAKYALNDMWALGATVGYDNGAGLVGGGEGTPGAGFSLFPYVKASFGDSYLKVGFVYAGGYDARDSLAAADAVMAIPVMYVISF